MKKHLNALHASGMCFVLESPGVILIQNRKDEHLSVRQMLLITTEQRIDEYQMKLDNEQHDVWKIKQSKKS